MADPTWFHSTLAQSVAALIGFILAFTAALYTNRRSTQKEEILRIWDCIVNLRENYKPPLRNLASMVHRQSGSQKHWYSAFDDFDKVETSTIDSWAEETHAPQSARAFAHIKRIQAVLDKTDSPSSIDKSRLRTVEESLTVVKRIFSDTIHGEELYREFSELGDNAPSHGFFYRDIFDEDSGIAAWFENNIPQSDPRRNRVHPHFSGVSGLNLYSMSILFDDFQDDFIRCVGDYITNFPGVSIYQNSVWILRVSGLLALLGIFLPLSMLITIPENPNGLLSLFHPVWEFIHQWQFWIQSVLLLSVGILAGRLIWVLMGMIHSSNS